MIQSLMSRVLRQKTMEKTMVVMVFLLLFGLSQASLPCNIDKDCRRDVCIFDFCKPRSTSGGACETNSHCIKSTNVCITNVCSSLSPPGGPCDLNDNADCVPGYKCAGTTCVFDISSLEWEGNKGMSTQRALASSVAVGDFLFVFGGQLPESTLILTNSVEMYDPDTNSWVSKANMPVPAWYHSVVAVGTDVYLIGGVDDAFNAQTNFYRYDTVNNVWSVVGDLPQLPAGIHSMAAAVVGTTIFCFGGQTTFSTLSAQNTIYSFDTALPANGWTTLSVTFPTKFTQASAVSVGTKIYITGGYSGQGALQQNTFLFDTTQLTTAPQDLNLPLTAGRFFHASFFNPSTNKIHLVGGLLGADLTKTVETLDLNNPNPAWNPEPSAALNVIDTANSGGLIGSRFYVAGSNTYPSSILNVLDVSSTFKWIPFAASPLPVFLMGVGKIGSSVITAGGNAQSVGVVTKTNQYDISTNSWTTLSASLTPARGQSGSAVVANELYSIGGSQGASQTFALKSDLSAWVQKASLNVARRGICAASQGTKIYAYGGFDETNVLDTMEIYDSSLNTWTDVTSSSKSPGKNPTAVQNCAAVSTGSKIIVFGGRTTSGADTGVGIIQSFDIASEKWDAPISTAITARYLLSATVLNGFVILSGGSTNFLTASAMATVEAFEISTGEVTTLPDLPSPRFGHGSVTDGDSVFVVGGLNGSLLAPVEKLRPPSVVA